MSAGKYTLPVEAFESAYPGSMCERPDGGYVRRDDADSLAGALVALVRSGDRAAEDAQDALKQVTEERDRLRDVLEALQETWRVLDAAGLIHLSNGVQLGSTSWYVKARDAHDLSRAAIAKALGEAA